MRRCCGRPLACSNLPGVPPLWERPRGFARISFSRASSSTNAQASGLLSRRCWGSRMLRRSSCWCLKSATKARPSSSRPARTIGNFEASTQAPWACGIATTFSSSSCGL
eukprot:Amastigsp_a842473_46.p7 type:complete len:109 gc:universal Amastigsp_a842473_46:324-650(+)